MGSVTIIVATSNPNNATELRQGHHNLVWKQNLQKGKDPHRLNGRTQDITTLDISISLAVIGKVGEVDEIGVPGKNTFIEIIFLL